MANKSSTGRGNLREECSEYIHTWKTFVSRLFSLCHPIALLGGNIIAYRSIVEDQGASQAHFVHDRREFSCDLHGRLDSINGHQEDAEQSGGRGSSHRFDSHGQVFGRFQSVKSGEYSGIGSRVAKTT
jgi:hypothetical protein